MIRVSQVKIKPGHTPGQLRKKTADTLGIRESEIISLRIVRQSVDARKKPDIFYSYVVDVETRREEKLCRRLRENQVHKVNPSPYCFPAQGSRRMKERPVIVGAGPAGLFCAYYLALHGYAPILLERGQDVDTRLRDVEAFWQGGRLSADSNVQFGEGGAGTFSDGKLNTLVKDKDGRNREVLECFVRFGAPSGIIYEAKPHIGTDVLCGIVKHMREEIIRLGGQVRFQSKVTQLLLEESAPVSGSGAFSRRISGVSVNDSEVLKCELLVLALGHSARDTFEMLHTLGTPMEAKSFAVGLRVEHPQSMINLSQYGTEEPGALGAASYKVTAKTSLGRGVYSFCMCPGGYVVNASSEPGRLAVNGMSYSGRDGRNANSAIIVSVTPRDFSLSPDVSPFSVHDPSPKLRLEAECGPVHPLAGIVFQRALEERAFRLGQGRIPVQRYEDFRRRVEEAGRGGYGAAEACGPGAGGSGPVLEPACKGSYVYADVSGILPLTCNMAFVEGMTQFGRQIPGFDRGDALLSGVESRTSSPVRICRGENMQSVIGGLYPCGEGAGYAGGITSAAMDGLRVAEAIASEYAALSSFNT